MKKGWKQTWKNLLFQHFEVEDRISLEKYLPKDCTLDCFDGKYYIGLVSMQMTNVRHRSTKDFRWFKKYNELNIRTYIRYKDKPGVLFLSLDVDSLISVFGARVFYGLPYRYRNYKVEKQSIITLDNKKEIFKCDYSVDNDFKIYKKDSFAFWATERYFFANKYLGFSFMGNITHKPWVLSTAKVDNQKLDVLKSYNIVSKHKDVLFCESLEVTTSKLRLI